MKRKAATHFVFLSLGDVNPYSPQGFSKNNSKSWTCYLKQEGPQFQEKNSLKSIQCKAESQWGTMSASWYLAPGQDPQGGPGCASSESHLYVK